MFIGSLGMCLALLTGASAVALAESPEIYYVAPSGNDQWSGRSDRPNADKTDGPLATIARARDAIRQAKQRGAAPAGGFVVEILAGRYELAEPIVLTEADSGTAAAPVVYRARAGETVLVSGSKKIGGWKRVNDAAVLARLEPAAQAAVWQTDLKAQGITDYGDIGYDAGADLQGWFARADGQGEFALGNAMASMNRKGVARLELFFDDRPMPLCRGPNEGFLKIASVLGQTPIDVRGVKGCKEGIFTYEGDRPSRWAGEQDAWVMGYWFRDWSQQRHKIRKLDTASKTIEVEPPYHGYGYRKGQWFCGINILAELDAPGEWYLDRQRGVLYFWPPGDITKCASEVSLSTGLFRLAGAAHITLHGLRLSTARGTLVDLREAENCRVVACTLLNAGVHGVSVFKGKQNGVVGCDMYDLGGGGVYLIGGDRATLTPAGHYAENNHIHDFGRWERMYRPAVAVSGVGNRVSHNLIHHAPHSAIIFGGNDHVFEYNEIHNVCAESHDCGAIYAGRSWLLRGNTIRYNYLHHIWGLDGGECNGVYLDDLFSSAHVFGNVFFQVTRPVFLGGGRDNLIENNVFVDCPKAILIDGRGLGWCGPHADGRIKEATEKGTITGLRFREPPFSTRYPQLVTLLDDEPKAPKGNVVRQNIFWAGTGQNLRRVAKGAEPKPDWWCVIQANVRHLVKLQDNLVNENPRFVDEAAGNFQLRDDSPAWKLGFHRIPFNTIGLQPSEERASKSAVHPITLLPGL